MKWESKIFEDAPIQIIDGDRGKNYPNQSELFESGYCLFLNTSNVTIQGFNFNNCQFITEDKDEKLRKGKLSRYDVLMTTRGTIGNVAYYSDKIEHENIRINSGMVIFRVDAKAILPNFLYLYLRSPIFKGQTNSLRSGVAQPQLPIRDIKKIKISIPPIQTQQKIADILSKYDDLIENNRRRIELLEESARLLYREWFVYLRFPSHEHTPIIDGIPEGWELVTLEKVLTITQGFSFKSQDFVEQETKNIVVTMGNFKENGGLKFNGKVKYLEENNYKEKYALKPHDLLIVMSDVTREGRIIGNVGLVPDDNNIYILNQRVAKLDLSNHLKLFFYMYFNSSKFKNHCLSRANSVTVLNLKNEHIYKHHVLLPSRLILSLFTDNIESIIKKIDVLTKYNIHLNTARDILIPRLMNGEIAV